MSHHYSLSLPIQSITHYSNVTESEQQHRIIIEVWDWDRLTANDFIGGMSMNVGELLKFSKEAPFSSWFKLLDEKLSKHTSERIIVDDTEAEKVREAVMWDSCMYIQCVCV